MRHDLISIELDVLTINVFDISIYQFINLYQFINKLAKQKCQRVLIFLPS